MSRISDNALFLCPRGLHAKADGSEQAGPGNKTHTAFSEHGKRGQDDVWLLDRSFNAVVLFFWHANDALFAKCSIAQHFYSVFGLSAVRATVASLNRTRAGGNCTCQLVITFHN